MRELSKHTNQKCKREICNHEIKTPTFISRKSSREGGVKIDLSKELVRGGDPRDHQSEGYKIGYPFFSGALSLKVDRLICCAHDRYD
jgi:hypothetical protein